MDLVITIAAYAITILATFLGLTGLLVGIGAMFGGMIGALGASCFVWTGINLIWVLLEGDMIPMAALIASFISLFFLDYKNLNTGAKINASGEQWGIVIVCIYIAVNASPIRWF